MDKWNILYSENRILDSLFMEKYAGDKDCFIKNCLELLVELGEFANETKCFKYWSIKKPKKEEVLEEYADCVIMTLYFFNYLNIKQIRVVEITDNEKNIVVLFNKLYAMASELMFNCNDQLVSDIFAYLLSLGNILNLTEDEIIAACYMKIKKNKERLNSNY